MKKKSSTFIAGVLAFSIYFTFLLLLLLYFNHYEEKKSLHFVKKNEESIRISLASPRVSLPKKSVKKIPKTTSLKHKKVPKKITKQPIKKKIIKEKIVKKPVIKKVIKKKIEKKKVIKKIEKKVTKPKKSTIAKDLFANVKTQKSKEDKKIIKKKSASELFSDSLKVQKKRDKGIENAYFAKIEERLKGWPAQAEYVGEKAKVWIKVEPSGKFKFKVISASGNMEFNTGLIIYLRQLQMFGFGRHQGKRAYELNVAFEATN